MAYGCTRSGHHAMLWLLQLCMPEEPVARTEQQVWGRCLGERGSAEGCGGDSTPHLAGLPLTQTSPNA